MESVGYTKCARIHVSFQGREERDLKESLNKVELLLLFASTYNITNIMDKKLLKIRTADSRSFQPRGFPSFLAHLHKVLFKRRVMQSDFFLT